MYESVSTFLSVSLPCTDPWVPNPWEHSILELHFITFPGAVWVLRYSVVDFRPIHFPLWDYLQLPTENASMIGLVTEAPSIYSFLRLDSERIDGFFLDTASVHKGWQPACCLLWGRYQPILAGCLGSQIQTHVGLTQNYWPTTNSDRLILKVYGSKFITQRIGWI